MSVTSVMFCLTEYRTPPPHLPIRFIWSSVCMHLRYTEVVSMSKTGDTYRIWIASCCVGSSRCAHQADWHHSFELGLDFKNWSYTGSPRSQPQTADMFAMKSYWHGNRPHAGGSRRVKNWARLHYKIQIRRAASPATVIMHHNGANAFTAAPLLQVTAELISSLLLQREAIFQGLPRWLSVFMWSEK